MGNPFSGDVPPQVVARYMSSPDRLASMLKKDHNGVGASPAAILADLINVQRADVKAMADACEIVDPQTDRPLEIKLMSEDRAAELLAGVTQGDAVELVMIFNELSRKRDLVLRDLLGDGYGQFFANKTSVMLTDDPEGYDDDEDDEDDDTGA